MAVAVLLVIITSSSLQYSSAALIEKYSPSVSEIDRFPDRPVPDEDVQIVASVTDKFASIQNATLSYSIDGGAKWQNVTMELTYGTLSDGTFSGTIPSQKESTEVLVKLYFQDDLGYSAMTEVSNYYVSTDHESPYIDSLSISLAQPAPWDPVRVRSRIQDYASGVKNATLHYSVNNADTISVPMTIAEDGKIEGKWDSIYEAFLPAFPENTNVSLFLEVYDHYNNYSNASKSYVVMIPQFKSITIDIDVSKLEARNIMGPVNVTANGYLPTNEAFVPINVSQSNSERPSFALKNQQVFKTYEVSNVGIFVPEGDPWNYPIDRYALNLTFTIPFKDVNVSYFVGRFQDREMIQYWNPPQVKENSTRTVGDTTVSNIYIEFTRNPFSSFSPIILPLIAAYALLGGTFVLANSKSQLGNRLVLTLGVFAFLFSFSTIIQTSRPVFAYGLPTLAENMVSQLLSATIAYTMSSLIGYRSKTILVDVAFFGVISYFIMTTFYASDLRDALVTFIVISLGYGFVFRQSEFRILKGQLEASYWHIRRRLGKSPVKDETESCLAAYTTKIESVVVSIPTQVYHAIKFLRNVRNKKSSGES